MRRLLVAAALAACATSASAQDDGAPAAPPISAPDRTGCCTAPAGTPVLLEFAETLDSKVTRRGDRFNLRTKGPLIVDGQVVIPAGAAAVGEVVDAQKAGLGGKPGELLVTARYITVGDAQVALRGFKVSGHGSNKVNDATIATLAVGLIGYVGIRGGEMVIMEGAVAEAKLAAPITLPPQPAGVAATPPAQVPAPRVSNPEGNSASQ